MSMVKWFIGVLLGWISGQRAKAEDARMEAQVERVRREAVQDRAAADQRAAGLNNPQDALRRGWTRDTRLAVLVALAASLGACAKPAPVAVDAGCDWVRPILIEPADQFTDRTARALLAHNETWDKRCGGAAR